MKRGILSPTTALELLEAQAATGYILDPANNGKLTVDDAFRKGLVGSEFREKLLTAEKIATGFTDMLTGKVLTLQRVLQKRPDLKVMAVNLLEVQAATGGIIEPQASIRLPLKMAYEHNVIDTDMFRILSGVGEQAKGFHDPDTGDKISYKDLLGKCVCDSEFGLSLLPVKEKEKDRRPSSKSSVRARKIIIIDPDTKREMTVYEAYRKGFIDVHTYYKLTEQEGEWKETVTIMPDGSVSTLLMDSKSGKEFNIDDALAKGILTEASFKQYKEGSISVSELAGMLSASAPVHEVQPSSPRSPQTGSSDVFVEYGSLCSFNDPTEETTPVAGILDLHEKEYITIKEAMKRHLVDGSTGQKLFEAQACTGGIIDPATGQRYSLDEAVAKHLIDKIMKERIQLAEKAFKGFEDARNKTVISTAQAMKKGSLYTEAGQRYLEVQYLTGGLIEPGIKGRVPIDEALRKGTISEVMIKKLRNVYAYAKYMICPKTKAKISYKEAMDRSKIDAPTGLRFLEASTLTSLGVSAQQAIAVSGSSSSFGSTSFFGSGSSSVDSGGHSTGFSTHTFSGQTSFSSGQRVATSPTMLSNESDHFLGVGSVSESSKLLSDTEAPEMMMHVAESDSSRSLQPSCDGASHKVKAADGSANLFNSAGTYRSPPLSSYAISHDHVDGSMLGNTPEQLIEHHHGHDYLTPPEKQNAEVKDDENVTYYILKKSPPGSPPNKMSDTDFDSSKINVTSVVYSSGSLADYMAQPTKENVIPAITDVVNTLGVEGLSYGNVSGSKTTSPSTQNLKCVYSDEGLCIKASNQHREDEPCAPLDICESELYNQEGKNVTGTSQTIEGAPQSEKRSYFEHEKGEKPSMSENSFYNFSWAQRWQKEQGCLVPQNELVECPRNGVAVYFGLDKTLLGDSDDDDLSCDNSPKAQASCSVTSLEQSREGHLSKVDELLSWVSGIGENLQSRRAQSSGLSPSSELLDQSCNEQQSLVDQLSSQKDAVAEAIRQTELFLAQNGSKLSEEQKAEIQAKLDNLKQTYQQLCEQSAEELQQLHKEAQRKGNVAIAGIINQGTSEVFSIYHAVKKGLLDHETGLTLLETQVILSGLVDPRANQVISLKEALHRGLIDDHIHGRLEIIQLHRQAVSAIPLDRIHHLPVVTAVDTGQIPEAIGVKILEAQLATGGLIHKDFTDDLSLEKASQLNLITPQFLSKLLERNKTCQSLLDPNSLEKVSLSELLQRCIYHEETGQKLLPVGQTTAGIICLKSGRKVSVLRAVHEGLIDRHVMLRLLECQLFAGGIVDPRTGRRMTAEEAVNHNLIDHETMSSLLVQQVMSGGIVDPSCGQRLSVDEAVAQNIISPTSALVVLESLQAFRGLIWVESGELMPVSTALHQDAISTDTALKVLENRHYVAGLYVPEAGGVLSIKESAKRSVLDIAISDSLKGILVPDENPFLKQQPCQIQQDASVGDAEEHGSEVDEEHLLLKYVLDHSYMDTKTGHRLIVMDAGVTCLTRGVIEGSHVEMDINEQTFSDENLAREENRVTELLPCEKESNKGEMPRISSDAQDFTLSTDVDSQQHGSADEMGDMKVIEMCASLTKALSDVGNIDLCMKEKEESTALTEKEASALSKDSGYRSVDATEDNTILENVLSLSDEAIFNEEKHLEEMPLEGAEGNRKRSETDGNLTPMQNIESAFDQNRADHDRGVVSEVDVAGGEVYVPKMHVDAEKDKTQRIDLQNVGCSPNAEDVERKLKEHSDEDEREENVPRDDCLVEKETFHDVGQLAETAVVVSEDGARQSKDVRVSNIDEAEALQKPVGLHIKQEKMPFEPPELTKSKNINSELLKHTDDDDEKEYITHDIKETTSEEIGNVLDLEDIFQSVVECSDTDEMSQDGESLHMISHPLREPEIASNVFDDQTEPNDNISSNLATDKWHGETTANILQAHTEQTEANNGQSAMNFTTKDELNNVVNQELVKDVSGLQKMKTAVPSEAELLLSADQMVNDDTRLSSGSVSSESCQDDKHAVAICSEAKPAPALPAVEMVKKVGEEVMLLEIKGEEEERDTDAKVTETDVVTGKFQTDNVVGPHKDDDTLFNSSGKCNLKDETVTVKAVDGSHVKGSMTHVEKVESEDVNNEFGTCVPFEKDIAGVPSERPDGVVVEGASGVVGECEKREQMKATETTENYLEDTPVHVVDIEELEQDQEQRRHETSEHEEGVSLTCEVEEQRGGDECSDEQPLTGEEVSFHEVVKHERHGVKSTDEECQNRNNIHSPEMGQGQVSVKPDDVKVVSETVSTAEVKQGQTGVQQTHEDSHTGQDVSSDASQQKRDTEKHDHDSESVKDVPSDASQQERDTVKHEDDSESVKDVPSDASQQERDTVKHEDDSESVKDVPSDASQQERDTVKHEDDSESVKDVPSDASQQERDTAKQEDVSQSVKDVPSDASQQERDTEKHEDDSESVKDVPSDASQQERDTAKQEDDSESVKDVPSSDASHQERDTAKQEDDSESVNDLPSDASQQERDTAKHEDYSESVKDVPSDASQQERDTVKHEDDSESVKDVPSDASQQERDTVKHEDDSESVKDVPSDASQQERDTVKHDDDSESVKDVPSDASQQERDTVKHEDDSESVKDVPSDASQQERDTAKHEDVSESVKDVPSDASQQERDTVKHEDDSESVKDVPSDASQQERDTEKHDDDSESVKDAPSDASQQERDTVKHEDDSESVKDVPSDASQQEIDTVKQEDDSESVKDVPSDASQQERDTVKHEDDSESVKDVPSDASQQERDTVKHEDDSESVKDVPSDASQQERDTVKQEDVSQSVKDVPPDASQQERDTVKQEDVSQSVKDVPSDASQQERDTDNHEDNSESVKDVPSDTSQQERDTVKHEDDSESLRDVPSDASQQERDTVKQEDDSESVKDVPSDASQQERDTVKQEDDYESVKDVPSDVSQQERDTEKHEDDSESVKDVPSDASQQKRDTEKHDDESESVKYVPSDASQQERDTEKHEDDSESVRDVPSDASQQERDTVKQEDDYESVKDVPSDASQQERDTEKHEDDSESVRDVPSDASQQERDTVKQEDDSESVKDVPSDTSQQKRDTVKHEDDFESVKDVLSDASQQERDTVKHEDDSESVKDVPSDTSQQERDAAKQEDNSESVKDVPSDASQQERDTAKQEDDFESVKDVPSDASQQERDTVKHEDDSESVKDVPSDTSQQERDAAKQEDNSESVKDVPSDASQQERDTAKQEDDFESVKDVPSDASQQERDTAKQEDDSESVKDVPSDASQQERDTVKQEDDSESVKDVPSDASQQEQGMVKREDHDPHSEKDTFVSSANQQEQDTLKKEYDHYRGEDPTSSAGQQKPEIIKPNAEKHDPFNVIELDASYNANQQERDTLHHEDDDSQSAKDTPSPCANRQEPDPVKYEGDSHGGRDISSNVSQQERGTLKHDDDRPHSTDDTPPSEMIEQVQGQLRVEPKDASVSSGKVFAATEASKLEPTPLPLNDSLLDTGDTKEKPLDQSLFQEVPVQAACQIEEKLTPLEGDLSKNATAKDIQQEGGSNNVDIVIGKEALPEPHSARDGRCEREDVTHDEGSVIDLEQVLEVRQQECSQKLSDLESWLDEASSGLSNQDNLHELNDLQQQQLQHQMLQRDLATRAGEMEEMVRNTQRFLDENRERLDPEFVAAVEKKLAGAKSKLGELQAEAQAKQRQLDASVSTAIKQKTEKLAAAEQLEENKDKIDQLLGWLSSLEEPQDEVDSRSAISEHDAMKAYHQQVLAQQQGFLIAAQQSQAFLDKHGASLPPDEREKLERNLANLRDRFEATLALADGKWRLVQEMQDDAGKFGGECDEFEGWLDQAEGDMGELGRSAADPESLRSVRRRHGSFSDDVVSHKGDLRYLSRSGQKVLGAIKAYEELCAKVTDGPSGPSFNTDAIAVTIKDRLQQVNGRFGTLRAQCDDLGSQLVDRQEKYKHYQEASSELVPWLQQAELAADKLKSDPVAATADGLQRQLEEAKKLKEDVTAHKTAMQRFTRATEALLATTGEPLTNQQEIQNTLDDATRRYEELSRSSAEHGERLEAALEQSVSLQDGLEKMLQWLEEAERQVEEEASGPVTSHSVRQMMTDNESLQEELKRKRGRMASMREKIEGLLATADPVTAADLKEKLRRLEERFETLDGRCQDKDANLGGLAEKMEVVERATERMGSLMAPGEKGFNMVDGGGGMDFSEMSRDVKWRSSELSAESEKMEELQKLAKELAEMEPSAARDQMLEKINGILAEWHQLQEEVREREAKVASFQLQLDDFRVLVESLRQWLTETEGRVPSDASTGAAESLQEHVQLVQSLLVEWEAKGPNVDDVKKQAEELEKLLATMVSADAVTESQVKSGSIPSSSPSVNGHSTSKELATIQSDVSDVSGRYDELGHALRDRERAAASALERVEQVRGDADSLMGWLADKLQDVSGWSGAPSEGSAIKSEAERNKLLLSEIENNLPKVQALRQQLRELLEKNPDSPEADKWRSMLKELDDQWAAVHQSASERQQQLEESCGLLETFRSLESQLSQWLMEKQLMMSVLGPLSIDPNMLANQKQQVQFMLKEFEARRPQYDQLNQAAQGILGKGGENREANERVAEQHAAVNGTWGDITGQLSSRSDRIDKALETSATYADALRELSDKVSDLGAKLSKQGPLSTQPEVVKRQLEEAGEIAGEIELQKDQLEEAEYLCQELSDLVQEPYLQTEIRRRLGSVMVPFKELEERAGDRMNQLQTALASSQQFQQMFDELRGWLDEQRGEQATMPPISAKIDQLQAQLQQQSDFLKSLNQHAGTYHVVVAEGEALLQATQPGAEKTALQTQLASLKEHWEDLMKQAGDRHHRLQDALKKAQHYKQLADELRPWVEDSEGKLTAIDKVSIDQTEVDRQLAGGKAMRQDVERRHSMLEALNTAADNLIDSCQVDEEMIRDEKAELNQRMDNLTENVLLRVEGLEEMAQRLKEFHDSQKDIQKKLDDAGQQIRSHDAMGNQAFNNKQLEKMKAYHEGMEALAPQVDYMHNFALGLVADASEGSDTSSVVQLAEETRSSFDSALAGITERCSVLDGRLQGVNRFQGHVRELFTSLTDLDDELDTMGPTARDVDTLQCQLEDLGSIQEKLLNLRDEIRKAGEGCTKMQENESGMDLQGVKREVETLKKQSGRLADRTDARQAELQETLAQVEDFHRKIQVLSQQLQAAEATEDGQGPVAAELELINQQMETFQSFQKGEVEPLQVSVQELNTLGHGLVQSAAKSVATQGLEHELEETNACWNTLNKKVAERAVQLQRALLHCGKFQDALESLLSWLADTEELIANQKPPSAEYKVVKAQIQEQKLLALLLDDRKHSIEVIRKEGQQIADSADAPDKEKILKQLSSLGRRWEALTSKADARQKQLEGILVVAQQFHETLEPLSEWLSGTEKKLSNLEPIGTQAVKIQQQISQHKSLEEDVNARSKPLHQLLGLGQALKASSGGGEREAVQVQLEQVQARYLETAERARRRGELLGQALAHARLFGDDEVELLNWLAEAQDRLADMSPSDHQPDVLQAQHDEHLSLHEEIVSRKQTVDQAIKNGQNLLKQTTGDEILTIQEKLDGIKSRYAEITGSSTRALKTLEKALHLATKFHGTHRELNEWLGHAESEMATCDTRLAVGEQLTAMQDRVNTLHKDVMERRLTLDTVNEVSSALLELVPWRAREGLDRLVADDNARYRVVSDAVARKTDELDAAVQRSQQFEQTADNELAWVAETERKLRALGDVSLEQDTTTSQLQVQKAFTIDILRHKDSIDQLVKTGDELKVSCSEEEKAAMESKLASLLERYDVVSRLNTARLSQLERAQLLSTQFWETYEELMPWLVETRESLGHLPPPSIEQETLRQQQEELRQLRESIAEHKPYVDKLKKIGPQLEELSLSEGPALREKYTGAERLFEAIREDVRLRALGLDEALSQSSQFHDKMDVMLEGLGRIIERLRMPPPIPAEAEKIKEQLAENKNIALELEKLQPMFNLLKESGEELVGLSGGAEKELNAKAIKDKLGQMLSLWEEIQSRSEERENRLLDVLDLAERFWTDLGTMLATLKETREYMQDLEELGVDPSLIKQQEEYMLANKNDIDGFQEDLEILRYLGTNLISACGEPDKPEVKKSIDEMNSSWDRLNKCWKDRMDKLEEAMKTAMQYQDALQSMFDWVENATTEMENLPPVGTDLETVKRQMEDLKQLKTESYQQQIEMERLSHQGELMLKRVKEEENRMVIAGPLRDLKEQWETLDTKILSRQHKMEAALLALGQFQHALDELLTWLEHTEGLLEEQKPVANEPKAIEIELAKHHVLRNDVLAHQSTVGTVQRAGQDLVLSSSGAEASGLQGRLDDLAARWESVLSCTEQRQAQLEGSLRKAQGFQGEMDGLLQWLSDMENQLSDTKPVGGLPETAKEQLSTHMEMCEEYQVKHGLYTKVLEQCQRMQNEQSGEPTLKYGIQDLEHKWKIVGNKLNERRAKLETALKTAIEFHNSLQDFIGWLTQMENNLNTLSPASLILDSVLFQIDEHKMLANEVNTHREQIIELDKTGTHLKYFSQKQDVALIKNLLLSVQARWEHIMQSTLERGRSLDDARKRAKQFHESWTKLMDWLEGAEKGLDHELDCGNDPERIKLMLGRHKDIQKSLGAKQPIYDSTTRTGRTLKERATLVDDDQRLDNMLSELRDKWDTICGKSVERQHKLEEALLFSGQFAEALQVLIDWLYKVEPHLAEDQPVHGDVALVMTLIDAHKVFQRELGKRASSVNALKRSARDLLDSSKSDASWVRAQMAELSARWDTVCKLSVSKQARLDDALKQAEVFRTLVQSIMDVLAEAEKTLRFHGTLPDDEDSLRLLIAQHKEFTERLEAQRSEVIRAVSMGEAILAVCHPDSASAIKQWINIIRTRFEEVMTWARQHQTRLEAALSELVSNSQLLEEMLAWLQKAQEMLAQRDQETLPEQIESLHYLISEHQGFMEEMMSKQPEMEQMTKSYKRKPSESHALFDRTRGSTRKRGGSQSTAPASPSQPLETKNPRITLLFNRWRQVWLVALERQRKLQDALERLQELKEFENFDFDVWRKRYMQWMNHKKSRVMDFFRRMDKDQDGKITRQEFIDGILSSRFPTNRLEMTAVADIFDRDGDGYIDYYEFIAALHPNKDAYRPITDADKIEDEVTRQVAACKCTRRFQVEQIGENKYRFYLGNQFGDSQQLRLVRILRSTVMVRVGGGWMALDEFLVKNDPCREQINWMWHFIKVHHHGNKMLRSESNSSITTQSAIAKGRTNLELREKFILPEGASQSMTPFRMRGKRSRPSSRTASPTRAGFAHSHGHGHAYTPTHNSGSCATPPSSGSSNTPSTPRQPSALSLSRNYDKPWLVNSKTSTPARPIGQDCESPPFEVTPVQGSRLRPPGYLSGKSLHTGDDSLTSDSASETHPPCTLADSSRSPSRTSSALGSRTGSRRGSESSELDASERSILQSDSEPRPASRTGARQTPKGSKIPTTNSATKLGGPASSSASSASKGARR
ncbi:microtubule-actin cross-linking factor 1-like isoform X2 [Lethenteron reissneri]|uniref:microtubule-actin cross-linking factor 1-like isoform X2 n=1 Tax=Lethenteron reissneri TaxID=7753 RepID=UPI002AB66D59|nr:microtubule-actin cross-linking factor 1-like isoform X2 [Lethenteron reissneri]